MGCLLTGGYLNGCRDNTGGIQWVAIANFDSTITYTLGTNDVIEGLSAVGPTYYTFQQEMEVGEFTEKMTASTENGTVVYEQSVTLTMHKLDATLKNTLKLLAQGNLSILILDQRGIYHLMGKQNGVRATEGNSGVGKALSDLNGVTITLSAKEPAPSNEVNQTLAGFVIS